MAVRIRNKNVDLIYRTTSREQAMLRFFRENPAEAVNAVTITDFKDEEIPVIGEMVLYRTDGRNGLHYDLPAIITVTRETHPGDYSEGKKNPLPVPQTSFHVHLTVFTPGGYGSFVPKASRDQAQGALRAHNSESFIGAADFVPGSGSYVEWNVPWAMNVDMQYPASRSWRRRSEG